MQQCPKLVSSSFSKPAHPPPLPVQHLLVLRTIAQDRNCQSLLIPFSLSPGQCPGQFLKVTAETLSHTKFIQMSPIILHK